MGDAFDDLNDNPVIALMGYIPYVTAFFIGTSMMEKGSVAEWFMARGIPTLFIPIIVLAGCVILMHIPCIALPVASTHGILIGSALADLIGHMAMPVTRTPNDLFLAFNGTLIMMFLFTAGCSIPYLHLRDYDEYKPGKIALFISAVLDGFRNWTFIYLFETVMMRNQEEAGALLYNPPVWLRTAIQIGAVVIGFAAVYLEHDQKIREQKIREQKEESTRTVAAAAPDLGEESTADRYIREYRERNRDQRF